jgi:enamine deaminase RidA (YjgF/YER057c/UK114 family)
MPRELVNAPALYPGVPYAYTAIVPAGALVFTAGACPLDVRGGVVAPGDVDGQARRAVENLLAALDTAGCGPQDVVKTTVFVASDERADLTIAWKVVEEAFGHGGPPSTLLGVAALGYPGQLVEIEAVAAAELKSAPPSPPGRR